MFIKYQHMVKTNFICFSTETVYERKITPIFTIFTANFTLLKKGKV